MGCTFSAEERSGEWCIQSLAVNLEDS